jgi:hypothetical protein
MDQNSSWPSGIRDTTEFPKVDVQIGASLREHLAAFCKMDGLGWNDYDDQKNAGNLTVTDQRIRTFRKMYEKLGLIYKKDGKLCLSRLGVQIANLETDLNREKDKILDGLRKTAIDILSRYQLRNPVDEPGLPASCDVLPCVCIWKAMRELDNKINYEEMNRVILHVMKMADLDEAINIIRNARSHNGNYSDTDPVTLDAVLGKQVHTDQPTARIAPWFSFAGWGGLIIEQNADDEGYRRLNAESVPLLDEVLGNPPSYYDTADKDEWLEYYIGSAAKQDDNDDEKGLQDFENVDRRKCGCNVLLYGVPGCGKSYTLDTFYITDAYDVERVVFHPDYTYADFVGQIMPQSHEGRIEYTFTPGPFTNIMREAYTNPDKKYALIIEELNRGNAPAIFGDIFQLLDRDSDGRSQYDITNTDIAKIVYSKTTKQGNSKVFIPSNLCIYATMNTSDQNVFTLDTAFQRRWRMRIIENDVDKATKVAGLKILDTDVTWATFNKAINVQILALNVGMTSSEDKRLGAYFITPEDLEYHNPDADGLNDEERRIAADNNHSFPEKIMKYLWDDAFKFTRDQIFKARYDSLEKLIKDFENAKGNARFDIFLDDLFGLQQN